jgi:putative DNA primase/helicase
MPPPTGSIYDEATGLVVDGAGAVFEAPPERPTKEQAEQALEVLFQPLRKFDFVGGPKGPHAAAAVASLLTAFARSACAAVPAFVFDAPLKGSGKSKLAALAPLLATGSDAGVINATARAGEEFEKRLASALLAARGFILIDNITDSQWDVPLLNSALTEPLLDLRIMGGNNSAQLPNTSQFAITGNNVSAPGDVSRRIVHCRVDPMVDDPAAREFDFDPRTEVLANRVELVKAALTILRGYAVTAESEAQTGSQRRKLIGREMGSFEDWVRAVRDALMWLGMADCITGAPVGDDEVQNDIAAFMKAWQDLGPHLPRNGASVRDMARLASERTAGGEWDGGGGPVHPAWREAVLVVAGTGGQLKTRQLGKWLARVADRRVGGACITRAGHSAAGVTWALRLPEEALLL